MAASERSHLIVLMIDGLSAPYLGPYGNRWIPTPAWDELAAESQLVEFFLADSDDLDTLYGSYFSGRHSAADSVDRLPELPARLASAGYRTRMLSDDEGVCRLGEAAGFERVEDWSAVWADRHDSADRWEGTGFGLLSGSIAQVLSELAEPTLLWIHLGGMLRAWDAPYAWRERFAAEDDPAPPTFILPPESLADPHVDPDELLGISQAYAAQVMVLDASLGHWLDTARDQPWWDSSRWIVCGARGYALGLHGSTGPSSGPLGSERLHVPCLVRRPRGIGRLERCRALHQPSDLAATLCESAAPFAAHGWSTSIGHEDEARRLDRAVALSGDVAVLRTPAWLARFDRADRFELFAKPDDRWEINEVSDRRPELRSIAEAAREEFLAAARSGRGAELPPLAGPLCDLGE